MNYIIDVILVGLILLVVFIGSKKGFVVTLTDLAAGILAVVAAKLTSSAVSEYIYDNFLKVKVIDFLSEKYALVENGIANALDGAFSLFEFLPDGILAFIKTSGFVDSAALSSDIVGSITTVEQLEAEIVSPVVLSVLGIICFAVLSILFVVLFRIVGRLIAGFIKISKLAEKLDSVLGAVFGLVKGCLYAFILAAVISVVSFSSETLAAYAADSYICSFVAGLIGF